jgi:5-deoxy-glucuronate isomerase
MPQLRVRPKAARGLITEVTPESAGWTYVGFSLHRLEPEDTIAAEAGAREVCLVLVSGKAALQIDGKDFGVIGERMSPFEGPPWAAYTPTGKLYRSGGHPPRTRCLLRTGRRKLSDESDSSE